MIDRSHQFLFGLYNNCKFFLFIYKYEQIEGTMEFIHFYLLDKNNIQSSSALSDIEINCHPLYQDYTLVQFAEAVE